MNALNFRNNSTWNCNWLIQFHTQKDTHTCTRSDTDSRTHSDVALTV